MEIKGKKGREFFEKSNKENRKKYEELKLEYSEILDSEYVNDHNEELKRILEDNTFRYKEDS